MVMESGKLSWPRCTDAGGGTDDRQRGFHGHIPPNADLILYVAIPRARQDELMLIRLG